MPASPLFALIAPSTQTTQVNPLSKGTSSEYGALSPLQEPLMSTDGEADSSLSFFQQLQMANEQPGLPTGQEFAAYLPQALQPTQSDTPILNTELIGPPPFPTEQTSSTSNELINQLDEGSEMLTSGMVNTQPMQVDVAKEVEKSSPQGLQHLENLRRAQPHVQSSHLAVSQEDAHGEEIDPQKMPESVKPLIPQEQASLQTTVAKESFVQEQAEASVLVMNASKEAKGANGLNLDELGMDGVTDESTIDDLKLESTTIHDTPKTLTTAKELAASSGTLTQAVEGQVSQDPKVSLTDITSSSLVKDPQTHKSMALDQGVQNQTQVSEKSPASFNKLDVPPQHPQWNDQVAKRISIMANESVQSARIQLDPPELGALEVKIKVQHDQVSVSFGSNNQMVRDALEAQTPRLRELLEQQGVNLADVNVSEQGAQQGGQGQDGTLAGDESLDGDFAGGDLQNDDASISLESDSLVDYFA